LPGRRHSSSSSNKSSCDSSGRSWSSNRSITERVGELSVEQVSNFNVDPERCCVCVPATIQSWLSDPEAACHFARGWTNMQGQLLPP
jgi:hypothetical protein